jgi:hypothetical protein
MMVRDTKASLVSLAPLVAPPNDHATSSSTRFYASTHDHSTLANLMSKRASTPLAVQKPNKWRRLDSTSTSPSLTPSPPPPSRQKSKSKSKSKSNKTQGGKKGPAKYHPGNHGIAGTRRGDGTGFAPTNDMGGDDDGEGSDEDEEDDDFDMFGIGEAKKEERRLEKAAREEGKSIARAQEERKDVEMELESRREEGVGKEMAAGAKGELPEGKIIAEGPERVPTKEEEKRVLDEATRGVAIDDTDLADTKEVRRSPPC